MLSKGDDITDNEITNLINTVMKLNKIDENCRQSFFLHLWHITITDCTYIYCVYNIILLYFNIAFNCF